MLARRVVPDGWLRDNGAREERERERRQSESERERAKTSDAREVRGGITTRRLEACHLVAVISCVVRMRRRMWRGAARAGTLSFVVVEGCVV